MTLVFIEIILNSCMDIRRIIDLVETVRSVDAFLLSEDFNQAAFLSRVQAVQALIARGATEGERAAAQTALERLMARAEQEIATLPPEQRANFRHMLKRMSEPEPKGYTPLDYPPRPSPSYYEPIQGRYGSLDPDIQATVVPLDDDSFQLTIDIVSQRGMVRNKLEHLRFATGMGKARSPQGDIFKFAGNHAQFGINGTEQEIRAKLNAYNLRKE